MSIEKVIQDVSIEDGKVDDWVDYFTRLGQIYLPKIAAAIATLVIGWWVISRFNRWFKKTLISREVELSLIPFLCSLFNVLLKVLLLVTVASMLGIATTSFIAVLGAASLAVGLALQGSLSNFAGGVLILLFKPFKVGDFIESDGVKGTVERISVLSTVLTTATGNSAILPNGTVANNKILNFSMQSTRRVDLTIGIGYDEDINLAKKVLITAMEAMPNVLADPPPIVVVTGFGDSSVNLSVRPTALSEDYWDVYFQANEAIKKALDDNNIEIPYPHQVEIRKTV
jgi:small conductance mechanosensitive channel